MQNDHPVQETSELTEREQEILKLVATGTSNKDIAHQLFISSNTVKVHLRNIFAKIGAVSRTEAAMYAVGNGLVKPPAVSEQGAQTKGSLLPSSTISSNVPAPRRVFRLASIAAVIIILASAVGMGIFFARQKITQATTTSQTIASPESRWRVLASMPTARGGLAVTAYENHIYAIGGDTTNGVTGRVEKYDPTTNVWVQLLRKPIPVTDVNAAVIGGRIYVPGGRTSTEFVTDALEIYDPIRDTWLRGSNVPIALSAYAMAAFEGQIYLFGGWDGKKYLNSVFNYDPGQDKWTALTSMPEARAFAGAAVAGGKIYVIGGYDGKQALAVNEIFIPNHKGIEASWENSEELPTSCYDMGIGSVGDNIYIVARQGASKISSIFFPITNRWQAFDPPPMDVGDGTRLAQLGEYLYVVGGRINNKPTGYALAYKAIYTFLIPDIISTK